MVLVLLLWLAGPAPTEAGTAAVRDDPPVQVWLNQDNAFRRGDRAQVRVRVAEDGYLIVLRADADGRIRVLFPLDPGGDHFVRGGEMREIHGRGAREAFVVDDGDGTGKVLAAWSQLPFQFADVVRGDHWDYRGFLFQPTSGDQEAALLDIIERMAGDNHFDYDVATYTVATEIASSGRPDRSPCLGCSGYVGDGFGWPHRFSFSLAFGDPFFFRPLFFSASCFDPFFFDPFFCDPFFFDPFFFPHRFFFPPVVVFSRTVIVVHGGTAVVVGVPVRRLLIDRARPRVRGPFVFKAPTPITATGPRLRVPTGALLRRAAPAHAAGRRGEPMSRQAAPPIRDRRPRLEQRRPAPRIEDRSRAPVRESLAPIRVRRQTTHAAPAARPSDRLEPPPAWRAPERPREPGFSSWGRAPTIGDRGSSVGGVSGRTFALPSRPAGSLRRGGGGKH